VCFVRSFKGKAQGVAGKLLENLGDLRRAGVIEREGFNRQIRAGCRGGLRPLIATA